MWQMFGFASVVAFYGSTYAAIDLHPLPSQANVLFLKLEDISIPHTYRHIQVDFDADARFNEALAQMEWLDHGQMNDSAGGGGGGSVVDSGTTSRPVVCTNVSATVCADYERHMAYVKSALRQAYREYSRSFLPNRQYPFAMQHSNDDAITVTESVGTMGVVRNEFRLLKSTLNRQMWFIRNMSDVLQNLQRRFALEANAADEDRIHLWRQQYVRGIIDYGHLVGHVLQLINDNNGSNGHAEQVIEALLQLGDVSSIINIIGQGLAGGEYLYSSELVDVLLSSEISVHAYQNCLNIRIKVPIARDNTTNSQFENYRIISLPFAAGGGDVDAADNGLQRVGVLFDYVSFNRATNSSILSTESQFFAACKAIRYGDGAGGSGANHSATKTCAFNVSSLNVAASNALACELDLFLNRSAHNCVIERYGSYDVAIYQPNPNTFFCVMARPTHSLRLMLMGEGIQRHNRTITIANSSWFQLPAGIAFRFAGTVLKSTYYDHTAPIIYYPRSSQLLRLNHTMAVVEKNSSSVAFLYFNSLQNAAQPPSAATVSAQFLHRFFITLTIVGLLLAISSQ